MGVSYVLEDRNSNGACGRRHDDADCRERACRLFSDVFADVFPEVCASDDVLVWDGTHHLQAHAHVGDRDYVLIASRDEEHEPVLLEKDDWDHVSHAFGPERGSLLRTYAIRRAA